MASKTTSSPRVITEAAQVYDSQGFGNGETIAGAATLLKVLVANKSASQLWLALFDGDAASGTPQIAPVAIPAGASVVVDLTTVSGEHWCGVAFAAGLTWAASTGAVFAQDSSNSMWVTAIFVA